MPSKYMIHTREVPHRFKALTKSGVIAWEEGCLKCAVCVKKQCIYNVYNNRDLDSRQMIDSVDNQCMNCLRCVQNCPKELIQKSLNPEYAEMGDSYWSPDIIARLWYQAQTGKIPVSGAGYPGPFSGPGFDSMWTDMSEIVRPTRDGIHGREYISTSMDLGRTHRNLLFSEMGEMINEPLNLVDIPLPIILRLPDFGSISEKTLTGWAMAAKELGTFFALPREMIKGDLESFVSTLIPVIDSVEGSGRGLNDTRLIEADLSKEKSFDIEKLNKDYPSALVSIRLPLRQGIEKKIFELIEAGVSIIHLEGDFHGFTSDDTPMVIKDGIRSVHLALVEKGVRDEITLIASGGIAMAEHVAKAIICGVDAVYVDFPALIALECRMCRRCEKGLSCPVDVEKASSRWVSARTINLVGAWQNQLLEVMGAMGIRDVRRLRGEAGRAMFFEKLDANIFGSLGSLKEGYELE